MSDARSRLIVALDLPDRPQALRAVETLAGHVGTFKVGLELFVSEGPAIVSAIVERGERVFLDLKLHDIPNTVAGAVRSACNLGVQMLTLHAAGGRSMLEAALEAAHASPRPPLLLAVTALTSLSGEQIRSMGVQESAEAWVERLAGIALQSGVDGLVTSPLEVARLRAIAGPDVKLVTPGIRPAGSDAQDQARKAEPGQAILAGADYLVVGRPILRAADPAEAASLIVAEIREALDLRGRNRLPGSR